MSPDIFLDDFEITENTEELQAILGRCLIVATRFDYLCDHTSKYLELKNSFVMVVDRQEFEAYATELIGKFRVLYKNIESLPIADAVKDILHAAREARNEIAHSLTIGLTGCLDTKIDESNFKSQVIQLIQEVAAGDYTISVILSLLNKEPLLQQSSKDYQNNVVNWVLGE
ncbi:hypothetical protein [Shewanella pealeana]|uniref:hypothetical protein n=1 Tax=Shewanella pealeana TaxID=70864 RepID=UPI00059E7BB8|nr:hypothetical protein [Shewanella pealeana]